MITTAAAASPGKAGVGTSNSIHENLILEPSDTIVLGEKEAGNGHFYLDYDRFEDINILDPGKHSVAVNGGKGGSNFTFADGSSRFLRYGQSTSPINLWATAPDERKISLLP
jgi:prepilin-type processing-associated H-X9-DG protein